MYITALTIICTGYHMPITGQLLPTNLIKALSVLGYNMRGNHHFPDFSSLGSLNAIVKEDESIGETASQPECDI